VTEPVPVVPLPQPRHAIPIPMRLTTGTTGSRWDTQDDEVSGMSVAVEQNIITGVELTAHMVAYLDESLRGRSLAQRMHHLEEVDPQAFDAYELKREGHCLDSIARNMFVSQSTVQRALGRARRAMGSLLDATSPDGLTYDQRMQLLRHRSPKAAEVYDFRSYGWDCARVADTMGLSIDQVKRLSAKAAAWMGELSREGERTARRQRWISRQEADAVPLEALSPTARKAMADEMEARRQERIRTGREFDHLTHQTKDSTVELPEGVAL
jgi:hypothetical protein